ncbi:MAG: flagellar M-ring protein FliF [Firmicutes bacterium HGW-Firmicutes-4]|jgi:flagellar M-ring protein FliF|nr:MAG: flagellar M-ring protein FliF [Firmicutes bacterium HGW-Firmicutes-4]
MNEKIKGIIEKIKNFWTGTSKKAKILMIGGVVLVLLASIGLTAFLNYKDYVPLFDDLTQAETTEIMAALTEMEADVKLDAGGNITVPKEDESRIRMKLATAGYPKNGLSYYVIQDNNSMLSTDYERKQYENMQLQERIGASIKTLEGVKDAIVTISVPTENVFYLQETEATTASVIIHLEPGATLTREQTSGIQNLVAKSVAGLSADNIALTDGNGNDLINNMAAANGGEAKLKLTKTIENDLTQKVNNVLDGPYDPDQYKVSVTATLNTDAVKQESTVYTPSPDGENSGVINQESSSLVISNEDGIAGGIAGTTGNTDVTTYAEGIIGEGGIITGINENTSYSVSQEITQTEKMDPAIDTVSIGIAINDPAMTPVARENLVQLVAFAAGVPPQSVTVRNFEFAQAEEEVEAEPLLTPQQLLVFGGIGAGVLLLLLVLLFVLTRGKKKKADGKTKKKSKRGKKGIEEAFASDEDAETDALFGALAADRSESIEPIHPVKDDKKEKVKEFAATNPEIAAQLFKSWLKNESE